jgi:hypothetical protein
MSPSLGVGSKRTIRAVIEINELLDESNPMLALHDDIPLDMMDIHEIYTCVAIK